MRLDNRERAEHGRRTPSKRPDREPYRVLRSDHVDDQEVGDDALEREGQHLPQGNVLVDRRSATRPRTRRTEARWSPRFRSKITGWPRQITYAAGTTSRNGTTRADGLRQILRVDGYSRDARIDQKQRQHGRELRADQDREKLERSRRNRRRPATRGFHTAMPPRASDDTTTPRTRTVVASPFTSDGTSGSRRQSESSAVRARHER